MSVKQKTATPTDNSKAYCGFCLPNPVRILLFASPGFPLARLNLEASQILEHASRANIAINTIDARGLYAPETGGDISQPSMDLPSAVGIKASLRLAEQNDQQFVLMDFAFGTGGTFFHSNDIEGGLKQAGSVPDVSYVLGFRRRIRKWTAATTPSRQR